MSNGKPVFVMALPACRGRAIGDNAIRRAVAIADSYQSVIISDSFPDQIPKMIRTIRVRPPRFNWLRRLCHVPNELGFAWAVRRALVELEFEGPIGFLLCHGYTLAWYTGRWFRTRTGTPFGMFMHGHIFERPTGTYDSRVTAFYRAIAPICYREADFVFALSPAQAELAVQTGAERDRVVVAPNGLDFDDVGLDRERVESKVAEFKLHQPLRLLYVGRLSMEKGVDVMLKACALAIDGGIDFRLRIIGTGPEEQKLMSLCADLGLEEVVEFFGPKSRKELGEHYLSHDVLLVPSISEPLGNVVLEGMAGGCVVVASNTGGIPSMVEDGVSARLCQPGDKDELSGVITELTNATETIKKLVVAGYTRLFTQFSWSVIGRTIVSNVNNIL